MIWSASTIRAARSAYRGNGKPRGPSLRFSPVPTPEVETPTRQTIEGCRGLCDHGRVIAEQGCRHASCDLDSFRHLCHGCDRCERKPGSSDIVDPWVEVLGHHKEVEPGLFSESGMVDQLFRMELLVAAEIAELGHAFLL